MKYSNILFIAILALLTACNSEKEEIIDFSGTYKGQLDCVGALDNSIGEEITITISQSGVDGNYSIDLGDEVVFMGNQSDNVLIIEPQTTNEDIGYDVVSLAGEIRYVENEFIFDFMHNVDDEGESECLFPIVKI